MFDKSSMQAWVHGLRSRIATRNKLHLDPEAALAYRRSLARKAEKDFIRARKQEIRDSQRQSRA